MKNETITDRIDDMKLYQEAKEALKSVASQAEGMVHEALFPNGCGGMSDLEVVRRLNLEIELLQDLCAYGNAYLEETPNGPVRVHPLGFVFCNDNEVVRRLTF